MGSDNRKSSREQVAAVVSLVSLLAAIGILWAMKKWALPSDGVIVALIFLLPIVVYLIASGKLEEFGAPGGWQVKFKQAAKYPLKDNNDQEYIRPRPLVMLKQEELWPTQEDQAESPIAYLNLDQHPKVLDGLAENPNVLKVFLEDVTETGPLCDYLIYIIISGLSAAAMKYIVFFRRLDNAREEFEALLPTTSINVESGLRTPDGECRVYELTEWIVQKKLERLLRLNGYVAKDDAASMSWSKKDCLRELSRKNLDALPLVKDGQLIGIVERTRLMTSILVDIVQDD